MIRRLSNGRGLIVKHIPDNSFKRQTNISGIFSNVSLVSRKKTDALISSTPIPDSQYFERLKREERRQFYSKRRIRYRFNQNYSAALELPCSIKDLQQNQNNKDRLLFLSRNNIIEHANRRVDLYFYTLIAYYKTAVCPTNGHTQLQHGRGRTVDGDLNLTQACHSSFTPSLVDNTIYDNRRGKSRYKSLLSGTHLMNNLNATVELPPFVNALDDVLENACRVKSIELLQDVSVGTINPIQGLCLFLNMMKSVLEDLKRQNIRSVMSPLNQHSQFGHKAINPKLIDLVLAGTCDTTFSEVEETVSDDYIQLLLRLTPEEKELCVTKPENKEKIYINKMMEMQHEILNARSTLNCFAT